jgi:hypothetical protein
LARQPAIGYSPTGTPAAEPTAIAALALAVHGRHNAARLAAEALVAMEGEQGNVGVRMGEAAPGWPTSLAIVAWSTVGNALRGVPGNSASFTAEIERAVAWLLANRGEAIPRSADFGHNTELVGWAYAEKTHSWVEPTSFAVLALQAAGQQEHPARREGIAVLLDRQLPGGGLNYGNTYVLGQLIRPHVQPTALALLALAGEGASPERATKSLAWLERSIGAETTPQSLAWAILALHAHAIPVSNAEAWLSAAAQRVKSRDQSPYKLALLALAAKGWPQ